jgi:hypothetical protein
MSTETIQNILAEIKLFQEKVDKYPQLTQEKDSQYILSDPWYKQVLSLINNLLPKEQATLVALMYLGQGDYKKSEWQETLTTAEEQQTLHIGQYLLAQPDVINSINQGLKILDL